MINVVADRSLLIAYTLNTKKIGSNIIKQAANDIGGLKLSSSWKRIFGKFIFTALVLAGLLIAGLDSFVDFNTEADPKNNEDIQQIIKENPIDLSDPGDLIPQEQPAPQNSLDPANQFDDPNAVGKLQLTQPDKLVTYLSSLSLTESKIEATKWILQSWGFKKKEVAGISDLNPEEMEIRFDLLTYELNGNLKRLATLNYPALLEITLPDSMGTKYIALVSVKDSMGEFGSVDPIYMPLSAIEPLWNGKAIIHWRDFENLPENFEFGHSGKEAIWLQKNLRLLGFFRGLEAPFYGHKTDRTVRKFQRKYHIRDDGKFGAESKLMLYNLLALYPTPKLIAP
jgi:hypothetical protein